MLERTEINDEDLLQSVRIYENNPVLEFELSKDYYVVDWYSNVGQSKFFAILNELKCPLDTPTIVQSEKKYPEKTVDVKLKEVLNIKDKVYFLSTNTGEYAIMWHKYKGRSNKRLGFASKKKNIAMLAGLLNKTSRKNLGDKIKPDLEKVLQDYKE